MGLDKREQDGIPSRPNGDAISKVKARLWVELEFALDGLGERIVCSLEGLLKHQLSQDIQVESVLFLHNYR